MKISKYIYTTQFEKYEPFCKENGANPVSLSAGQYLYPPGATLDYLYYIKDGLVQWSILTDSGHELVIAFYGSGMILPVKHQANQYALETVSFFKVLQYLNGYTFSCDKFKDMLLANPTLALDVISYYTDIVNLLATRQVLQFSSVYSRVISYIYIFSYHSHSNCLTLSQEEIASITGSSRVQVSRICQQLKMEGLINTNYNQIEICDLARLEALCSSYIVGLK